MARFTSSPIPRGRSSLLWLAALEAKPRKFLKLHSESRLALHLRESAQPARIGQNKEANAVRNLGRQNAPKKRQWRRVRTAVDAENETSGKREREAMKGWLRSGRGIRWLALAGPI